MLKSEVHATLLGLVFIELAGAGDQFDEACFLTMDLQGLFVEFALVENLIDQLTDTLRVAVDDLQQVEFRGICLCRQQVLQRIDNQGQR